MQTPGPARVLRFEVGGHSFGYRTASRADEADALRRFALKTALAPDALNDLDGDNLLWEARLEIGLRPRKRSNGEAIDLGEHAPPHWVETSDGITVITFEEVPVEEFRDVIAAIRAAEDAKKKPV